MPVAGPPHASVPAECTCGDRRHAPRGARAAAPRPSASGRCCRCTPRARRCGASYGLRTLRHDERTPRRRPRRRARRVGRRPRGRRAARRLGRRRREDRAADRRPGTRLRQDARRRPAVQPAVRDGQPLEAQHRRSTSDAGRRRSTSRTSCSPAPTCSSPTSASTRSSASGSTPTRCARATRRLVYGIITGYGLEGDERDRAAYDIGAFWARSGIAGLLTAPGGQPPFQRGGMGDHGAGMTLAAGICAALARTRAHRRGPARRARRCCATACTRSASTSTPRCASACRSRSRSATR